MEYRNKRLNSWLNIGISGGKFVQISELNYLLSGELATHLTGRYNEIRLFPFSFSEYCSFHHVDTSGLTTKADAERKTALCRF